MIISDDALTNLKNRLIQEEGLKLTAYPDPLTGGHPWTIGVGHTGNDVHEGWTISHEQALEFLYNDLVSRENLLVEYLPLYLKLDDARRSVLLGMAFNMGVSGVIGFHDMINYLTIGNYTLAAQEMGRSKWSKQVPSREQREAKIMDTGVM